MTIIKTFEPEEEKGKSLWGTRTFASVFGFFLFFLIVAEIWVANTMANFGERFDEINKLQSSLEQENQLLENEISKYSSLLNIATSSAALGLIEGKSIKYIR